MGRDCIFSGPGFGACRVATTGDDEEDLAAGDFSAWLREMQGAIRGEHGSTVPCGGCTACCTSSQFVYIGPEETDTLAHISASLLFPAPRRPPGSMVMGYDERGHCPMLVDNQCSIYPHRPQTCRTYDCRVFVAAGIEADDDKVLIARQARRWSFSYPSERDRQEHDAVRVLAERTDRLNATQVAIVAIEQFVAAEE
jgi:uncharacterized protein